MTYKAFERMELSKISHFASADIRDIRELISKISENIKEWLSHLAIELLQVQ